MAQNGGVSHNDQAGAPRRRLAHEARAPLQLRRVASLARSVSMRRRLAAAAELPPLPDTSSVPHRAPSRPPVFVLTAGWRSGSTAVQRLIVSGGEAFVWGEPFQTSRLLARLDRIARESTVADGASPRLIRTEEFKTALALEWLATTNPEVEYLMTGVRDLLQAAYWTPLMATSFATWGVKEVTLTPAQIRFLLALFPDAHFVCIVRNPVDAYDSFRDFVVRGVTPSGRPDSQLTWTRGPASYARVWRGMARTLREAQGQKNVSVFRYEDINGRPEFPDILGQALSMKLDPAAWSARVGGARHRSSALARAEGAIVHRLTRTESAMWGYA